MNTKKMCIYCNANINKGDKVCPVCNKKQKLPLWCTAFITIFILFMLGAIGSGVNNSNTSNIKNKVLADTTSNVNTSEKDNTTLKVPTDTTTSEKINTNTSTSTINDTSEKVVKNASSSDNTSASASTSTSQLNNTSDTKSYTAYITKTGKKYHRSGCKYLSRSCISISSTDAISEGYTPCSVCNP